MDTIAAQQSRNQARRADILVRSSIGNDQCSTNLNLQFPAFPRLPLLASLCLLFLSLLTSCSTLVKKLPPANLKETGWTVHEGQAVWHLPQGGREFAGEVLVATRPDGTAIVQFTKSPFPLVLAQENAHQWQVEFPPQNKHYAGRGQPPKRLIWLYLPRVLAGKAPPKGWTWRHDVTGWKLANGATSESLEGFFNDAGVSEIRNPKSEARKKAEIRRPNTSRLAYFGFRISAFGFLSDF